MANVEYLDKVLLHTGIGFDTDNHSFGKKEDTGKLAMGSGVIDGYTGSDFNSVGDIILQTLFNAISRSLGEESAEFYSDPLSKIGITDTKEHLKVILSIMEGRGFEISSLEFLFEGENPPILQYEPTLKDSIASIIKIPVERIAITASAGESHTEQGENTAIHCFCILSLKRRW